MFKTIRYDGESSIISSGVGVYILEQKWIAKYSEPISSYCWRVRYSEESVKKLFANFLAPFHESQDGYLATFTLNEDLKGLISFKSFSNLLLIPGILATAPVMKIFETNFCCTSGENFFNMNSIVSDMPACSWPMMEGWKSISEIRICSVAKCSWCHSGESLAISDALSFQILYLALNGILYKNLYSCLFPIWLWHWHYHNWFVITRFSDYLISVHPMKHSFS